MRLLTYFCQMLLTVCLLLLGNCNARELNILLCWKLIVLVAYMTGKIALDF